MSILTNRNRLVLGAPTTPGGRQAGDRLARLLFTLRESSLTIAQLLDTDRDDLVNAMPDHSEREVDWVIDDITGARYLVEHALSSIDGTVPVLMTTLSEEFVISTRTATAARRARQMP